MTKIINKIELEVICSLAHLGIGSIEPPMMLSLDIRYSHIDGCDILRVHTMGNIMHAGEMKYVINKV